MKKCHLELKKGDTYGFCIVCGEKMIFLKHQTDLTSYPYNTVNQMVPHVTFCEPYIYL